MFFEFNESKSDRLIDVHMVIGFQQRGDDLLFTAHAITLDIFPLLDFFMKPLVERTFKVDDLKGGIIIFWTLEVVFLRSTSLLLHISMTFWGCPNTRKHNRNFDLYQRDALAVTRSLACTQTSHAKTITSDDGFHIKQRIICFLVSFILRYDWICVKRNELKSKWWRVFSDPIFTVAVNLPPPPQITGFRLLSKGLI